MLQEHGFESTLDLGTFLLDSEHFENVAIFGNDIVSFGRVVEVLAIVQKVELGLRMHLRTRQQYENKTNKHVKLLHVGITIMYTTLFDLIKDLFINLHKSSILPF